MKKPGLLVIWGLFLLLFGSTSTVVEADYNPNAAVRGYFPRGTISVDGQSTQSVTVSAGTKVNYTVSLTSAAKVCKVEIFTIGANNSQQALSPTILTGPRGTGADTATLKGIIDTTSLKNGQYRVFMYARTDCPDGSGYGHDNDGFDCDGNPTCWSYCDGLGGTREKIDSSQQPFEPGSPAGNEDLYRTSSNTAYYSDRRVGTNSCGEPAGTPTDPTLVPNGRNGECELVACDASGKNLDNFTLTIGPGGGAGASPTASVNPGVSTNPKSSATPVGSPTSDNIILPATNTAGQVQATQTKIDLAEKLLDMSAGVRSTTNNQFVDASLQSAIGNGVAVGSSLVKPTKAVNLTVNAANLVLVNGNSEVNVTVPAGTTILGTDAWDGKLVVAPVTATGTDIPVGFKVKGQVVEIGSSQSPLIFSKPVSVDLRNAECDWSASEVTCDVSFKTTGQTVWTNIAKCDAATAADPSKLAFAKECYLPQSGSKTVRIWTYHFSQFASFSVSSPVTYLLAEPQVCLDKSDSNKLLLQFQFGVNPAYSNLIQAFTKCSSKISCSDQEQLLTDWKSVDPQQKVIDSVPVLSSVYGIKAGDIIKFRVGGVLRGNTIPANITDLADKYWSTPVFKRVSDCRGRGNGITIDELIINPQAQ